MAESFELILNPFLPNVPISYPLKNPENLRIFVDSKSSYRRYSLKEAVFKNFAIFIGKHVLDPLFNKVIGLRLATLLKKIPT